MPEKTYTDNPDPKKTDEMVKISEFRGLSSNADAHDIDPSLAAIQVNCYSVHPGELRARMGMKLLTFDGPSC